MDYLVSEGYPRAAEKFAKEANIHLPLEEESILARVEIRRAIHAGDIDTAITKINDLNPQVRVMHTLPPQFLAGLNSVSCTTHNFFDDNQTFSPQYDCKHYHILISHICCWPLLICISDLRYRPSLTLRAAPVAAHRAHPGVHVFCNLRHHPCHHPGAQLCFVSARSSRCYKPRLSEGSRAHNVLTYLPPCTAW